MHKKILRLDMDLVVARDELRDLKMESSSTMQHAVKTEHDLFLANAELSSRNGTIKDLEYVNCELKDTVSVNSFR